MLAKLNKSIAGFLVVVMLAGAAGFSAKIHSCSHTGKTFFYFFGKDSSCSCMDNGRSSINNINNTFQKISKTSDQNCCKIETPEIYNNICKIKTFDENNDTKSLKIEDFSCCSEKNLVYLLEIPAVKTFFDISKSLKYYIVSIIKDNSIFFRPYSGQKIKESFHIIKQPLQSILSFLTIITSQFSDEDSSGFSVRS